MKRFVALSKQIHELEGRNTRKNLQMKKEQLKDLAKTVKQLEEYYKKATNKMAKEKADVDKLNDPSSKGFFKDKTKFEKKMTEEMEEYLEAVTEQEIAKKQFDGVTQQKLQLEKELVSLDTQKEELMTLLDEQDAILEKIFDGAYGSDLENQLEAEFDLLKEKKERISVAKYKWANAKLLLEHAIKQLAVACGKWTSLTSIPNTDLQSKYFVATEARNNLIAAAQNITSAQRYLNNIKFPYCEPAEILTLGRACQNVYIDMQTNERHQHAFQCFNVTYRRAAALMQWFDSVLNNTISKDLDKARKELGTAELKLREERLKLIKEKLGSAADNIVLPSGDFDDDELEPELMAIAEPDENDGDGSNNLTVNDHPPKAPTPMPLSDLAPPPSQDELFGNIEQLKQQHEKELAEFEKAQETNKARIEQGLQEKLAARRNRKARLGGE